MVTVPGFVVIIAFGIVVVCIAAVFFYEKQFRNAVLHSSNMAAGKPDDADKDEQEFLKRLSEYVGDPAQLDVDYRECVVRLEEEYQDKKTRLKQFDK